MIVSLAVLVLARLARGEPDLGVTLRVSAGPAVHVSLVFRGGADGRTELNMQPNFAGVPNDGSAILDLRVTGAGGAERRVERRGPVTWSVGHEPAEALVVAYRLDASGAEGGVGTSPNDYRTRLTPELFQMHGEHGLLMPAGMTGPEPRRFRVSWEGLGALGWGAMCSFGPGEGPFETEMSGAKFLHSVFMAGTIRARVRTLHGNRVGFAFTGTGWGFEDDALIDAAMVIIGAQRDFFGDHSDPWFLVTLTPSGSARGGSFALGGTGVTNAFSMYANTGLSLEPDQPFRSRLLQLLSHEYFHTWNGGKLDSSSEEGTGYWFSEGFTNFYTRRMLKRAGLFTDEEVLQSLNEAVAGYMSNPERNAPAARVKEAFWSDPNVGMLPYQRGDMVALALDEHLRAKSGGARSLDDFMRDLVARAGRGEAFSVEWALRAVEREAGAEFAGVVRAAVVEGADVPLPETLSDPAARLTRVQQRNFEPGFDLEAAQREKVIRGVREGGPAWRAGLRDGQTLRGMNVNSGGPGSPPSAEVTIDENGRARAIRFEPLSEPRSVPVYVRRSRGAGGAEDGAG